MSGVDADLATVLQTIEDALLVFVDTQWQRAYQNTARPAMARVEAELARLREQRDAWQRHAGTSDTEVANLRLALTTVMGALDLEPVVPQLLAVDGANAILRRVEEIVDEADRGFRERDAAEDDLRALCLKSADEWSERCARLQQALVPFVEYLNPDALMQGDEWPERFRAYQEAAREALAGPDTPADEESCDG